MDSSTTLLLQTVTGKSGVIRAPSLEDKMKTSITRLSYSLLTPLLCTTTNTEPLPTDVVSGADSHRQLIVAIVMAVVLTVVRILIICIQSKKWGLKGVYMKLSHVSYLCASHTLVVDPHT